MVNPVIPAHSHVYLTMILELPILQTYHSRKKRKWQDETTFSLTVSAENADILNNVDILVTYGDDTTLKALQKDAIWERFQLLNVVFSSY